MTIRITAAKASWVVAAALGAGCHNHGPSEANSAGIPGPGGPQPSVGLGSVTAPAPAPPFVLAYGTVTALDGVWVSGARYDASGATITIDDQPARADQLEVGHVARVIGKPGFAASVAVKHALHGPVSSVDAAGSSFVALGQTVVVDAAVIFDESIPQRSVSGLAPGDVVQVAGLTAGDGKLFASRIAKKPLGSQGLIVTGTAANVDHDQFRFTVGGLAVDFRGAPWPSLPHETVRNGDRVEVLGASLSASGELVASDIRPDDPRAFVDTAGMRLELEGVIAAHDPAESPAAFTMHGLRVITKASTRYLGPKTSSWLGAKVEVEGQLGCFDLGCDSHVSASTVRFIHPTPVELRARVDSVDQAAETLVVLGITIETRPFTLVTDASAVRAQPFGVANVVPGDFVHVVGADLPAANATVAAALVERIDAESETLLRGHAQSSMVYRNLGILGVAITTNAATRYPTPTGADLGAATFFFDLEPQALVEVRGVEVADREIVASEARFMDWPW